MNRNLCEFAKCDSNTTENKSCFYPTNRKQPQNIYFWFATASKKKFDHHSIPNESDSLDEFTDDCGYWLFKTAHLSHFNILLQLLTKAPFVLTVRPKMWGAVRVCHLSRPAGGAGTSPRSPAVLGCPAPALERNLPGHQTPRPPTGGPHTETLRQSRSRIKVV